MEDKKFFEDIAMFTEPLNFYPHGLASAITHHLLILKNL